MTADHGATAAGDGRRQPHDGPTTEMQAVVRRGPAARPRDHEMIEYLMGHKSKTQERPVVEEYALEHVLGFSGA